MTVTTEPFQGTPSAYVRHVFVAWLCRWWWVWALPVAACVIGACYNFVWVFVALMIVCLLYPGVLMMIYFNYALSPEARHTLLPRRVTITDAPAITITYEKSPDRKNLPPEENYGTADVKDVELGGHNIVFILRHPRYHHISVPITAVPEAQRKSFFALAEKFSPTLA